MAVHRGARSRSNDLVAAAAGGPVNTPAATPPTPLACHDQPVATQAAGSSIAVPLKGATAAKPATPQPASQPTPTSVVTVPAAAPSATPDPGGCHPTPEQAAAAQT